jgi:hypothetical protein
MLRSNEFIDTWLLMTISMSPLWRGTIFIDTWLLIALHGCFPRGQCLHDYMDLQCFKFKERTSILAQYFLVTIYWLNIGTHLVILWNKNYKKCKKNVKEMRWCISLASGHWLDIVHPLFFFWVYEYAVF